MIANRTNAMITGDHSPSTSGVPRSRPTRKPGLTGRRSARRPERADQCPHTEREVEPPDPRLADVEQLDRDHEEDASGPR